MESYVKQMPLAKKDQIVLTKTGAVWYQNDVIKVLERHKSMYNYLSYNVY